MPRGFSKPKPRFTKEDEARVARERNKKPLFVISAGGDSTIVTDLSAERDQPLEALNRIELRRWANEIAPGHKDGVTQHGEKPKSKRTKTNAVISVLETES